MVKVVQHRLCGAAEPLGNRAGVDPLSTLLPGNGVGCFQDQLPGDAGFRGHRLTSFYYHRYITLIIISYTFAFVNRQPQKTLLGGFGREILAQQMYTIIGPVRVYGLAASVVYGFIGYG